MRGKTKGIPSFSYSIVDSIKTLDHFTRISLFLITIIRFSFILLIFFIHTWFSPVLLSRRINSISNNPPLHASPLTFTVARCNFARGYHRPKGENIVAREENNNSRDKWTFWIVEGRRLLRGSNVFRGEDRREERRWPKSFLHADEERARSERQSVHCSYTFDSCNGGGENSMRLTTRKNRTLLRNTRAK